MAVTINDIEALKNKQIYETSNEKVVLSRDYEKIIHSPQYTILGFLNGYMYVSKVSYLSKNTTDGNEIASIKVEVKHASFKEGLTFFYAYSDNIVYKITQNLEIEWEKEFEDEIQSITTDMRGDFYVTGVTSRDIRKYDSNGNEIVIIDGSDDPTKDVKLFYCFVSSGA